MGWERKRGKLSEFNRLLLGAKDTSYVARERRPGPPAASAVRHHARRRHDADPRHGPAARRHDRAPAEPAASSTRRRAGSSRGTACSSRRVSIHLTGATRSRFTRILASSAGIDPYSTAVSDVYMDLFDSGSFTGKGDLRRRRLRGGHRAHVPREPDPQPRPDRGELRAVRPGDGHRAVRRLPRPLPRLRPPRASVGPGRLATPALARPHACRRPTGPRPNPLPAPERWKVFDNLRRSLVPPSVVLLLVLGWTVLPGPGVALDAAGAGGAGPAAGAARLRGADRRGAEAVRSAPLGALRDVPATAMQSGADDRLPGRPGAAARRRDRADARPAVRHAQEAAGMGDRRGDRAAAGHGGGPVLPDDVAGAGDGARRSARWSRRRTRRPAGGGAGPAGVARARRWWPTGSAGRAEKAEEPLTEDERDALRRIARRTWRFFETFVGDEDHWLPPDNFQEEGGDRGRAPDLADQQGPAPALDAGGARPRLPRPARTASTGSRRR